MGAHARLKNEITEDEKSHNLMSWPISFFFFFLMIIALFLKTFVHGCIATILTTAVLCNNNNNVMM